jgi:cytochrome c oxidase subunit II
MVVLMPPLSRATRFALVCAVAVAALVPAVRARGAAGQEPEQVVEVTAERFTFQPSEIKTTVGTTLKIVLKSDDTTHGFRLKGEGINLEIPKRGRGTVTATFTPPKAGRYVFECSRICGAGHGFMRGEIVVAEAGSDAR